MTLLLLLLLLFRVECLETYVSSLRGGGVWHLDKDLHRLGSRPKVFIQIRFNTLFRQSYYGEANLGQMLDNEV
jgi:hypothetical protein